MIRIIIGIFIVVWGVSLLFDQLGLSDVLGFNLELVIGMYWPLVIVAYGVSSLSKGNTNTGLMVSAVGIVFLVSSVFGLNAWGILWPLMLVGLGFVILTKKSGSIDRNVNSVSSDSKLNVTAIFWGADQKVKSTSFIGGEVLAICGGAKIDLREVGISPEGATIDVTAICGGVEIIVPSTIRIEVTGDGVIGGWEKHFNSSSDTTLPLLTITGSAVFGGVEIRN